MFEVLETSWGALQERMDSAKTLDDLINAHDAYLADIMSKSLLNHGSQDVNDKLEEVRSIPANGCCMASKTPPEDPRAFFPERWACFVCE